MKVLAHTKRPAYIVLRLGKEIGISQYISRLVGIVENTAT